MAWQDDLREGSFRGVSFRISSHEYNSGRRAVDHEFPSKEEGNSEDIGKRLRKYNLSVHVLGDDYFDLRDELIEALDAEGPGELVHPFLGTVEVQVGEWSMSETTEEGRIARFQVSFTEAGVPKFPQRETDAFESALNAAEAVTNTAQDVFAAAFTVANSPARVATAASDLVKAAADQIDQVVKTVGTTADAVTDVAFAIREIQAEAEDLIRTPELLAERFAGAFGLLFDAADDALALVNSLSEETSSFAGDPVVGADTATTQRIQDNQTALENLIIENSLASQGNAAIQGNYRSVDESVDILALLNADIENHLDDVSDDDLFQNLRDMKVALNQGLPPQDVGQILTYMPPITEPVLVVSHRLFGNIEKEQEIIDQNNVRHPGFAPAQIPLEVGNG